MAAIIGAGVYVTQYRAPHAHVLTVGGSDFDAAAVASRATYMVAFESAGGSPSPAETALDRLAEEVALRERAPALVAAPTADDIEQSVKVLFRLADTGNPAFARADLQTVIGRALDISGLTRTEFDDIMRARVLAQRMRDRFRAEVPAQAPQLKLMRIRFSDEATAQRVREQLIAGGDFAQAAAAHNPDPATAASGGDLGWLPAMLLDEEAAKSLDAVAVGGFSALVRSGAFYGLYRVDGREQARALDEPQIARITERQYQDWLTGARREAGVRSNLSGGERGWIEERVRARLRAAAGEVR
ncbi:MAG: hypothetical protein EXR65_01285 [Dehalococcoidia bacterium]|nr:hypothetical protein [Dehalococcoidia bacterium]